MTISLQNAERLTEIQQQMAELLEEAKNICRGAMTISEYDQFRYKTLAHLEPGLITDHHWVVDSKPLETIAENAQSDATTDDDENDDA
jgi:hypothetical protein